MFEKKKGWQNNDLSQCSSQKFLQQQKFLKSLLHVFPNKDDQLFTYINAYFSLLSGDLFISFIWFFRRSVHLVGIFFFFWPYCEA